MTDGLLTGIRVLELSQVIAGPFVGVNLADLGADVVKIEGPTGEAFRLRGAFYPGESKAFHIHNRGKRSLVVDLRQDEGRALVHRIIPDYDVFVINVRHGVSERLGVDYDTLRQFRPDLVYLENTGFGTEGPMARSSASDQVAQAYSGFLAAEAKIDAEGAPETIWSTSPTDYISAYAGAMGICAALYRRGLTGQGEYIQTSLLMSALSVLANSVSRLPVADELVSRSLTDEIRELRQSGGSYAQMANARRARRARAMGPFTLYSGPYLVKDGAMVLGALTEANQQAFRDVWGITDDPSASPDFNNLDPETAKQVEALRTRIRALMLTKTMAEWMELFDTAGAPAAPVNFPEDMVDDPQVQAIDGIIELEHPVTGYEQMVGPVLRLRNFSGRSDRPSPPLGYHTDEVLGEHGMSADEIEALRSRGVVT